MRRPAVTGWARRVTKAVERGTRASAHAPCPLRPGDATDAIATAKHEEHAGSNRAPAAAWEA